MHRSRLLALAALALAASTTTAGAQGLRVQPSTRATVTVNFAAPQGQAGQAKSISIDYGQPHARGREIAGKIVPYGQVWRTGANSSTTLKTDVELVIGGKSVPAGSYSLYSLPTANGADLIVNKNTGQWGTEYVQAQDLVRVPMTLRTLPQPVESFSIWLVPSANGAPRGDLRMAWGTLEYTVAWEAK